MFIFSGSKCTILCTSTKKGFNYLSTRIIISRGYSTICIYLSIFNSEEFNSEEFASEFRKSREE